MMILIPLIILGVVVYYFFYNKDTGKITFNENRTTAKTAEEILKERFVNGEIDESTYLDMKETLKKDGAK